MSRDKIIEAGSCGQAAGRRRELVIMIFFILLPSLSIALSEDNKEKVYIVADSTVYDYKKGIKIFTGNVKVDQGSTHLTADKVITKDNALHQLQELTAYGYENLAHYWTLAKTEDPEIHAQAKIIKYFPIISQISLLEHVIVTQGDNSFNGEIIFYNVKDQTITVPASKNARAVVIYNPEK